VCWVLLVHAGKFGTSAAVGQVLPPKPQMLGKQDWRYVSGGGQVPKACVHALTHGVCPHSCCANAPRHWLQTCLDWSVQVCHGAHDADSEVTSFAFSRDDNTLLSRGADETLKVGL
jgi:hypothetical protein